MLLLTWFITPEETKKETAALLEVVEGTGDNHNHQLLTINGEEDGVHRRSLRRRLTGNGLDLLTKKDYMM